MFRRCGEKYLLFSVGSAHQEAAGVVTLYSPDMPEGQAAGVVPERSAREANFRIGTMVQKIGEATQALHAQENQHETQIGGGTPTDDRALSQKAAQGHAAECCFPRSFGRRDG